MLPLVRARRLLIDFFALLTEGTDVAFDDWLENAAISVDVRYVLAAGPAEALDEPYSQLVSTIMQDFADFRFLWISARPLLADCVEKLLLG